MIEINLKGNSSIARSEADGDATSGEGSTRSLQDCNYTGMPRGSFRGKRIITLADTWNLSNRDDPVLLSQLTLDRRRSGENPMFGLGKQLYQG